MEQIDIDVKPAANALKPNDPFGWKADGRFGGVGRNNSFEASTLLASAQASCTRRA